MQVAALAFAMVLVGLAQPSRAQDSGPKITFHGYLTQAYGESDGLSLFGLDEDGTSDYRNIALNLRADITDKDSFVVQLVNERSGGSPFDALHEDVELDWAYFEHRFETGTEVRVGRQPIPFGIYNELRDAGTVLEFFRPPVAIYFEGAFASETVDGLAVSHNFSLSDSWDLDSSLYYGEWERAEFSSGMEAPATGRARDGHGLQLWLNTPVTGLRFGVAAQRFDQVGGLVDLRSGESDRFTTYLFSIDGDFSRFVVRAEAQLLKTQFAFIPDAEFPAAYGLVGYHVTDKLSVYLLREDSKSKFSFGSALPSFESTFHKDWALSAVYAFNPQALLRLEAHRSDTILTSDLAPFGTTPRVNYWIASFSASF
ncbi:MAG: hypothetical protein HC897_17720 [Thermoanaerobaculia bacterium]|nr:hypothetical protein [Thermoanaerobaculia bacterium]